MNRAPTTTPKNLGPLWMLLAGLLFGCMGVFVKLGAAYFSHIELVFYRSFFGLLLVYLIMRQQRVSVVTHFWRNHLWRGISGTVALALFFYCITVLPPSSWLGMALIIAGGVLSLRLNPNH